MSAPSEKTVAEKQAELLEEWESIDSWKDRYDLLIDLGRKLEPLPENLKTEDTKIRGCVSQAWLVAEMRDGKLVFLADSDSLFVKGLIALVVEMYSGHTPQEILASPPDFLLKIGIVQNLSPNRANGFASMLRRLFELCMGKA